MTVRIAATIVKLIRNGSIISAPATGAAHS
jgi:hypothetical protein